MVNEIVSLISLSDFSLLIYRNAKDLCVLILYPATLLNSLISSSNFLVASLVPCHLQTKVSFNSYFPVWIACVSLSSLVAMARTSKTILNNSGTIGHTCLFPDLR